MEINYNLTILGEKVHYTPRKEIVEVLADTSHNIFEITAGNSYGKTFLLNLIAYACFADQLSDKHILSSIKNSISRYNDTDYCNLDYEIKLKLPNDEVLILRKRVNEERKINFKGEDILNSEDFHSAVTILYDVPTDPSERLNAVINDLGNWNNNLLKKMTGYWKYLRGLQSDFNDVRNESEIEKLEQGILSLVKQIQTVDKQLIHINKIIADINIIKEIDYLTIQQKKQKPLEDKLASFQRKLKTLKKPAKIKLLDTDTLSQLLQKNVEFLTDFKNILIEWETLVKENISLSELIRKNPNLKASFNIIISTELDDLVKSNNYVDTINNFKTNIQYIQEEMLLLIRREEQGKGAIVYRFLKQFLEEINSLVDSDADDILEDLTHINSRDLIKEIEKNIKCNEGPDFSQIKDFFNYRLENISNIIQSYFDLNNQIRKVQNQNGIDKAGEVYYHCKAEIDELKDKVKKGNVDINKLKHRISDNLGINEEKLESLEKTNRILATKNIKYKDSIKIGIDKFLQEQKIIRESLRSKKDQLEETKNMNSVRREIELRKSPSKFTSEEENRINKLIRSMQIMIKNLGDFNDVISSINSGDLEEFDHEEDLRFIDIAGRLIAYSMDNKILRVDGEYIKLNNYNLIRKEFYCEGDIVIRKEDISTGLASANYLKQGITNVEGDYLIILLDEIGDMSRDTMKEVVKSIKTVENQNRLVTALFTRPSSDGIKINKY